MKIKSIIATAMFAALFTLAACGQGISNTEDMENSALNEESVVSKYQGPAEVKYVATRPTGPEESSIYIEAVPGMTDDFIRGVDISSVLVEEKSGVTYKNIDGVEEDIFKILADAGVNYIRVRVWNDPFDSNGNGYGGGNCDYKTAGEIGRRAAEYGMKLLVDFHYSDFWADPSKQMVPKAWKDMSYLEKADACYDFTLEAMNYILDAGADVGMVQLGNETNNGMAGEKLWSSICEIMKKGREAVLEAGTAHGNDNIKIAVHFTNPENKSGIEGIVRKLATYDLEYDVFALSYYPYWHGTLKNLKAVMESVHKISGKEVMVVETSYAYTLEDGDGSGNSVSAKDLTKDYAATVQSQALSVRDIAEAVASVGDYGLGVFYWEPAWIPVGKWVEGSAEAESQWAANHIIWEQNGAGWASSFAGEYDPEDAGIYYGGSSWDNQAMFDHDGVALPSLYVFRYLQHGTVCDLKADFYSDLVIDMLPGEELVLPESAPVVYNDRSKNGLASVTWSDEANAIDTGKPGRHTVIGHFEDGSEIKCVVKIAAENLIENGSFEDISRNSMLVINEAAKGTTDFQKKEADATTGEWSLHYWSESAVDFTAEYTVKDVEPGTYCFNLFAQGGDSGNNPEMYIYVKADGKDYREDYLVDGWINWKHPEISDIKVSGGDVTVGVRVKAKAKAWGTFDDFYFGRID